MHVNAGIQDVVLIKQTWGNHGEYTTKNWGFQIQQVWDPPQNIGIWADSRSKPDPKKVYT